MELCERALEHGVFAQGIRPPTVPEGSSRLRLTVMASHREGELRRAARQIVACAGELGIELRARRAPRRAPGGGRPGRGRLDGRICAAAVFVTGTGTEVGKTVVAAVIARAWPPRGSGSRSSSRRVTGLDGAGRARPRAPAPRRRLPAERRADRALSLRAAASPHLAARAGRGGDRPRAAARGRGERRPRAPRRSSARASAACWCRSRPATWCATSPATWSCRW